MSCPEAYVNFDGQENFSGQNKSSYSEELSELKSCALGKPLCLERLPAQTTTRVEAE